MLDYQAWSHRRKFTETQWSRAANELGHKENLLPNFSADPIKNKLSKAERKAIKKKLKKERKG